MITLNSDEKSGNFIIKVFFMVMALQVVQVTWAASKEQTEYFPVARNLRLRVQFWINVFTRYSQNQYIIHDMQKPERIYRVVDFRENRRYKTLSGLDREKILKENVIQVQQMLEKLAKDNSSPKNFTAEEYRIYRLFGKDPSVSVFQQAVKQVRFQRGMKEKFRQGMERSKLYINTFKKIFKQEGIPENLVYLAHVESSFNSRAESRYGAVGIWQFTRSTGRKYLTINSRVDERRDPYRSSRAAAKLLKRNYQELGSWPLAVTAYNHGLYGVKKAMKISGSRDIEKIIEHYSSPTFGFASQNFYAEFMAVLYIINKSSHDSQSKNVSFLSMVSKKIIDF